MPWGRAGEGTSPEASFGNLKRNLIKFNSFSFIVETILCSFGRTGSNGKGQGVYIRVFHKNTLKRNGGITKHKLGGWFDGIQNYFWFLTKFTKVGLKCINHKNHKSLMIIFNNFDNWDNF